MRVLILINGFRRLDGNHALFTNGFRRRGWEVGLGLVNSLCTSDYRVHVEVLRVPGDVVIHGALDGVTDRVCAEDFDLVWVMNQPHPGLARDAWQILWLLSRKTPFVNSVEGMTFLNNKINLGLIVPAANRVESHVAHEFDRLWRLYESDGQAWVVKPTNEWCGANVFVLEPGARNARALLQSMTGNTTALREITDEALTGIQSRYCVLQRYAPEVARGEKRVIVAGGRVIAQHSRTAAAGEHRSNMIQGGNAGATNLSADEFDLCSRVAKGLEDQGVRFTGIDLCYPYILEFNIVNPAGLDYIIYVTGRDYSDEAIDAILASLRLPGPGAGENAKDCKA